MSKCKVSMIKKSAARKLGIIAKCKVGDPVVEFELQDNEDCTFTVFGKLSDGSKVDISDVATLAVTSSDTSLMTADAPAGMTVNTHGLVIGSVTLTFTASWNDGSKGPFSFDLPVTLKSGGATGILIEPGTPVAR